MGGNAVREKYLKFFESKGHKIIAPAPFVLKDDPTTLFTSSGMQPLVPYLMGKSHPEGKRLVDSQPSLRAQDIEEVGDNRHTTFFEMLGNWSLGDYFKKEQIPWIWEFVTEILKLPKDKLYISIFEGYKEIPEDNEAYKIWKSLGIPDDHIFKYGVDKNWWSRSGTPDEMPDGEIGGPDSEIFFEFESIKHDKKFGEKCHPNCDCGRFMEIANSVFMQYEKKDGKLIELPQKNVDFGGGLERLTAAVGNDPDIFHIDLFSSAKKVLDDVDTVKSAESERAIRIILDHIRASMFLVDSGVIPSNKQQGYVLRRLIRRAALYSKVANIDLVVNLSSLINKFKSAYKGVYFDEDKSNITKVISEEISKFIKTLDRGLKEITKLKEINAQEAFNLYQTYGFPYELAKEEADKRKIKFVEKSEFDDLVKKHQELSRKSSSEKFKIK